MCTIASENMSSQASIFLKLQENAKNLIVIPSWYILIHVQPVLHIYRKSVDSCSTIVVLDVAINCCAFLFAPAMCDILYLECFLMLKETLV